MSSTTIKRLALARVSRDRRRIDTLEAKLEADARAAREAGASIRAIAEAAGVNHETMRKRLAETPNTEKGSP